MQMSPSTRWFAAACGAVVALALLPQPAQAFRVTAQAVAICQGALPVFETAIRKRPLAIQNEGSEPAFVTCAFNNTGLSFGTTGVTAVMVYAQNLNSTARSMACTFVNSSASEAPGPALYLTKTVQVSPGDQSATEIAFAASELPGALLVFPGDTVGVSCNLLPGMGVTGTVLLNNAN